MTLSDKRKELVEFFDKILQDKFEMSLGMQLKQLLLNEILKQDKQAVKELKERGLKRTTYPRYLVLTYSDLIEIFGDFK